MADQNSVVLRGGTVLTLDAQHTVLRDADVLVTGDRVAAVGTGLAVPEGTREIDARDGIVMPGMIDTHRHMWQTAMRGYGADWTLTQYFVWYYLESGKHFRPQDVRAGNLLAAAEALDAGVTTCVDWSHGLQTVGHAEAAADALRTIPGRYVLAYGNIQQAPWEWSASADFQAFARRDARRRPAGLPDGLRRHRRPGVPREGGVRGGARARRARHHARGGVGRDERRRHPARARGGLPRRVEHLRARRHALGRLLPPHRGHRRLRVRLHRERAERGPGLPAHLGAARARHPGVAVDGHQRVVERRPVLRHAHHAGRRPLPRALRGPPEGRHDHPLLAARRARRRLGHPGRRRRAGPLRRPGQPGAGQEGRRRAAEERRVAGVVPGAQPVRARGVPGPARRRAHGAGGRARREGRAPPRRGRPGRDPPRGGGARSSTCAQRSARRHGRRA